MQNLLANPRVRVRVGPEEFPARGRVIDADADPATHGVAQELSEKKYGWGDGLVVELTPKEERSASPAHERSRTG